MPRSPKNSQAAPQDATATSLDTLLVLGDLLDSGLWDRLALKERLYVALLTERQDLLRETGFSTFEALATLPTEWAARIARHWLETAVGDAIHAFDQGHRGDPVEDLAERDLGSIDKALLH